MAYADNMTHCWDCEEATGDRVDHIGLLNLSPVNVPGTAAGKINNAVSLVRASNQALTLNTPPFLQAAPFSIACWFQFDTIPASDLMAVFSLGANTSAGQYDFLALILATGQLEIAFGGGSGGVIIHPDVLATGVLHFLGLTHDGTHLRLKVNGDAWDDVAAGYGTSGSVAPFNIGAVAAISSGSPGTNHLDGLVDSFMTWDVAKADADIEAVYNGGAGVDCAPVVVPNLPWLPHPRPASVQRMLQAQTMWAMPLTPIVIPEEPEVFECTEDREARVRFLLGRRMHDVRFPQALLSQNVLRGERDVAVQALAFQERTTLRLQVGVQAYALPDDYITSWALQIAKFSAGLRLYDSNNVAWYLIVTPAGDVSFTSSPPAVILGTPGLRALALVDELLTVRYVYPSLAGAVTVNTVSPGTPVQTAGVQLRDTYGTPWYAAVSSLGVVSASRGGTATLVPPVLEPRAMVYVAPQAFTRLDPVAVDTPLYFSVFPSKQLRIYPAPTAVYDVEILYFGDGLLNCDVPRWVDMEVCWHAVRLAQIRVQHDGAARAASEFEMAGLQRLGPLYFPEYEQLDFYKMPVAIQPASPSQGGQA